MASNLGKTWREPHGFRDPQPKTEGKETAVKPKPYISPELIEFLNTAYPNRCPSISTPERQVWHDVGARSVVEHLIRLHSEQVKKDMT